MQRFETGRPINETAADPHGDFVEEGAFCTTTNRIVMISPFPASVRSLFTALTVRCYDVLLFHHENDPVLKTIQSDLMIIDRTRGSLHQAPIIEKSRTAKLILTAHPPGDMKPEENFLQWPCPIETALAKIESAIKNSGAVSAGSEQLRWKDIVLDLKRYTVQRNGVKVDLTRTEFDMLKALLESGGSAMTRQEIMDAVWGDGYFGGSNSVDVHIKSIRQKLGDDPKQAQYIATVRGVGYRIAD